MVVTKTVPSGRRSSIAIPAVTLGAGVSFGTPGSNPMPRPDMLNVLSTVNSRSPSPRFRSRHFLFGAGLPTPPECRTVGLQRTPPTWRHVAYYLPEHTPTKGDLSVRHLGGVRRPAPNNRTGRHHCEPEYPCLSSPDFTVEIPRADDDQPAADRRACGRRPRPWLE